MAGKKGKASGGTSTASSTGGAANGRGAAGSSGGGRSGQPLSGGGRPKPASGQGGAGRRGRKGKGRAGPAGDMQLSSKQLLRAMASLGLHPSMMPRPRPLELERPSLPGIGLLQRIGGLSPGTKLVAGELLGPDNLLRFDFDMVSWLLFAASARQSRHARGQLPASEHVSCAGAS